MITTNKKNYKALLMISCLMLLVFMGHAQAPLPNVGDVTGAQIDESGITNIIYVNQQNGNDNNNGKSAGNAVATIKKGMEIAAQDLNNGIQTKISIANGKYRESVGDINLNNGAGVNTLLVIEGQSATGVEILGSDVWNNGWAVHNNNIYKHTWDNTWGNSFVPWEAGLLAHRSEMVFINGNLLDQKILENWSASDGVRYDTYEGYSGPASRLTNGSFGVSERNDHANGQTIFIDLPDGVTLQNATIEVAIRDQFISFREKSNVVIRNLVFKHFRNQQNDNWKETPIVEFTRFNGNDIENVLVENCQFLWNNQSGLKAIDFSKFTVRGSIFNYNGGLGISMNNSSNVIFEGNKTNFNNWRNYWGGLTTWFLGGIKIHETNKHIVRNHEAIANIADGVWWDIHCKNVQVENLVSLLNFERGCHFEIGAGPYLLKKSLLAHNYRTDVHNSTVKNSTLENVIIYGKTKGNFNSLIHQFIPRQGNSHWEREPFSAGKITVKNSVILGSEEQFTIHAFRENRENYLGQTFTSGDYTGTGNVYFHESPNATNVFRFDVPERSGSYANFVNYMNGNEANSQWADPMFESAANFDFRIKAGSPIKSSECHYKAIAVDRAVLQQAREFFNRFGVDEIQVPQGTQGGSTNNCEISSEIISASAPLSIARDGEALVTVQYEARQQSDIYVRLEDVSDDNRNYGSARVTVEAGKKEVTLTLPIDGNTPIHSNYKWQSVLAPVNGGWEDRYSNYAIQNVAVTINDENLVTDLTETNTVTDEVIHIYPNPVVRGGALNIRTSELEFDEFQLRDLSGRLLQTELLRGNSGNHKIKLNKDLVSGMYLIRLSSQKANVTSTIVIE